MRYRALTKTMVFLLLSACGRIDYMKTGDGNTPDVPDAMAETADAALSCGNGIVDSEEECDDGNELDTDGCLSTCVRARCGDGFVRAEVETCDDGNTNDSDGCTVDCNRCGDLSPLSFYWREQRTCYSYHEGPIVFRNACNTCVSLHGRLVQHGTVQEYEAIRAVFPGVENYWINLYWTSGSLSRFRLDVHPLTEPLPVTPWAAGEPLTTEDGYAVVMDSEGSMYSVPQSTNHGFVCERSIAQQSVVAANGHAYVSYQERLNWDAARASCAARGGYLATLATPEEQVLVTPILSATVISTWIGASERETPGSPVWITGEPFEYTSWETSSLAIRYEGGCLFTHHSALWNTRVCSGLADAFLCEFE